MQLQLNRGKYVDRDGRLFSEQRSKEMWSGQTILPIGDMPTELAELKANFADYALGWGLRDYHGRKLIGHTGGVGGFVSRVMLVPEENLGVVVLTNADSLRERERHQTRHVTLLPRRKRDVGGVRDPNSDRICVHLRQIPSAP